MDRTLPDVAEGLLSAAPMGTRTPPPAWTAYFVLARTIREADWSRVPETAQQQIVRLKSVSERHMAVLDAAYRGEVVEVEVRGQAWRTRLQQAITAWQNKQTPSPAETDESAVARRMSATTRGNVSGSIAQQGEETQPQTTTPPESVNSPEARSTQQITQQEYSTGDV